MTEKVADIYITIPTIPERHRQYAFPVFTELVHIFGSDRVSMYDDVDRALLQSHLKSWANGLKQQTKWVAVAEDDIILTADLGGKLRRILAEAEWSGYRVVNLYSNYQADVDAMARGKTWRKHPGRSFRNEQFLVMRREVVERLVDYFHQADLSKYDRHWSDVFISDFFKRERIDVWITLPNLVNHMNEKSSIGHPQLIAGKPRKSRTFQP